MAFLKKTIGDLHQISTLQMKYKRTVDGKEENREGTPAEILGMPQSALDEMRKARLIRYLENDDEKRIKVLLPVVEQAYAVLKPFLVSHAGSAEEVRLALSFSLPLSPLSLCMMACGVWRVACVPVCF